MRPTGLELFGVPNSGTTDTVPSVAMVMRLSGGIEMAPPSPGH